MQHVLSVRACVALGILTGILAFTPYYDWRREHAIHHATSGDLDRRGTGDVYTMTVCEYLEAPWWKKTAWIRCTQAVCSRRTSW